MNDNQRLREGMSKSAAYAKGYHLSIDGKTMLDKSGMPARDANNNVMVNNNGTMRRQDGK